MNDARRIKIECVARDRQRGGGNQGKSNHHIAIMCGRVIQSSGPLGYAL